MSNVIMINRGDSYSFDITIEDDTTETGLYELTENDAVYFGLMEPHQPFEHAILKKKFTIADVNTIGLIPMKIRADETVDLEPGIYYYAIKLLQNAGTEDEAVVTVINKTKFIIND